MQNIIVFRKYFFIPTETFIYHQVSYLKKYYNIHLVSSGFSSEEQHDFKNINKIKLNKFERILFKLISKIKGSKIEEKYSFYNPLQLKNLIKKEKIKLIHAHFGKDAIRILPLAKKNKIPLIISFHGYDASGSLRHDYYKNQLPQLFDYASKIIIVSNHMMNSLELEKWKNKVELLPYGIDVDIFKPSEINSNINGLQILHSGRLVSKKGVPDLIDVFAKLVKKYNHIRLRILGDGPELTLCKQKVDELDLNNFVSFLGSQPPSVVKKELNEADIFVLNSRIDEKGNMEGTPVSLLEAMSMGKAAVSTYHAGIPDVIQNEMNGLLVPEKDNHALEVALDKLIKSEELRKNIGLEARKTVVNQYSQKHLFPKLKQIIEDVI
jgi:colanic acid/amylovoran biosynthesis glycosyltransferase